MAEGCLPDTGFEEDFLWSERVIGDDLEVEPVCPLGDGAPDVPKPNQTEGLASSWREDGGVCLAESGEPGERASADDDVTDAEGRTKSETVSFTVVK